MQKGLYQQRTEYNKKLNECKDLFTVPGLIGPFDSARSQYKSEGKPYPFMDYKSFVQNMY